MTGSVPPALHPDAGRHWWLAVLVVVAFVGGGGVYVANSRVEDPLPVTARFVDARLDVVEPQLRLADPEPRTIAPYEGYGTWVDVFDFDPAYGSAPIGADDLAEMADLGVTTLYLQAARLDERTPDGLVDPWRLTDLLLAAHAEGIRVVAWYLPRFGDGPEDLDRVSAMARFAVLGHRFDGIALDIEWIGDGVPDDVRSARLVALSAGIRAVVGDDPLGAIVPPPVQTEVLNPQFWPGFPWGDLAPLYQVWLPMSYWSFRTDESGYGDGYAYHEESVRRLRADLGDPDALVHGIGGIGGVAVLPADGTVDGEPVATVAELERFADALRDTGSIGGSIYDWNTLEPAARRRLAELFGSGGPAADLAVP
ncbi:MAG: hypothetical protein R2695_13320 [Acidimicrobiales bacterium]